MKYWLIAAIVAASVAGAWGTTYYLRNTLADGFTQSLFEGMNAWLGEIVLIVCGFGPALAGVCLCEGSDHKLQPLRDRSPLFKTLLHPAVVLIITLAVTLLWGRWFSGWFRPLVSLDHPGDMPW